MLKVNSLTGFGGSSAGSTPLRGVFAGGDGPRTNVMDYIDIATLGNAVDFGDLSAGTYAFGACSDGSRGVFGGGYASSATNVIEYITIATVGNATNFGNLTLTRHNLPACANAVRGVFGSGYESAATGGIGNTIDYITIASTGNATDFGNVSVNRYYPTACADATRGVFAGGYNPYYGGIQNWLAIIDYITISSTGNATSFGNLSLGRSRPSACADATRGVVGGGYGYGYAKTDRLDYITIQTTGNATDFGNLAQATINSGACADATRGVWGGGYATSVLNVIQYITIQTTGNTTDFGDLTENRYALAACSGA